ncbi:MULTISPECIES: hypothetical protein [Streptomyces]
MAANISLDFAEIERVSNLLKNSADNTLVPRMTEAKNEVDTMLNSTLKFNNSSPALQQSYEKLTQSLTEATQSIKDFAEQFEKIVQSMRDMDDEMANKIRSSG